MAHNFRTSTPFGILRSHAAAADEGDGVAGAGGLDIFGFGFCGVIGVEDYVGIVSSARDRTACVSVLSRLCLAAIARREQQEYVVSAMPEIGHVVAKNLLRHFGTVAAVMITSREELMAVELVGPKIRGQDT